MEEAGDRLLKQGKFHNHPTRTLVVLGSDDKNVPLSVTAEVEAWSTESIRIEGYGYGVRA